MCSVVNCVVLVVNCVVNYVVLIVNCVVLLLILLFLLLIVLIYVLFVCKCVLYYCHRVSTQLHLKNISYCIISSYHIISHIISYHIISYHITSHHIIYHITQPSKTIQYQSKLMALHSILPQLIQNQAHLLQSGSPEVQMTCTGDGVLAAITSGKSLQFTVTRKVFTAKTKSSPLHCFQILDTTPSYMKE